MAEIQDTESVFDGTGAVMVESFEDLFPELNQPESTDPFSAPTEEVPQQDAAPEQQTEQISPEEQRVRDWQAKFDKLQGEYGEYKAQAEEVNKLWSYVQTDPSLAQEVFSTVERSLSGEGSSAKAAESISEPQEPAPPEKPSDYNENDAYMEPDSSSFKYRIAADKHQLEMQRFVVEKELREIKQSFAPIMSAYEQEKAMAAQREQLYQVQQSFTESGLSDEEANVVTNWAAEYKVTPQDIVSLYKLKNGAAQLPPQQTASQAAPDRLQRRNNALDFPVPSTMAGAARDIPKPQGESMFDEILSFEKAKNPFT